MQTAFTRALRYGPRITPRYSVSNCKMSRREPDQNSLLRFLPIPGRLRCNLSGLLCHMAYRKKSVWTPELYRVVMTRRDHAPVEDTAINAWPACHSRSAIAVAALARLRTTLQTLVLQAAHRSEVILDRLVELMVLSSHREHAAIVQHGYGLSRKRRPKDELIMGEPALAKINNGDRVDGDAAPVRGSRDTRHCPRGNLGLSQFGTWSHFARTCEQTSWRTIVSLQV